MTCRELLREPATKHVCRTGAWPVLFSGSHSVLGGLNSLWVLDPLKMEGLDNSVPENRGEAAGRADGHEPAPYT